MTPYTEAQQKRIAGNIVKACKDINKLSPEGYKFISLACGFIAHYNRAGFIEHYSRHSLRDAIERNARPNQWHNFTPTDRGYAYYMSKREIYNRILGAFCADEFIRQHVQFIHIGA
jgi:hypothetical protein